MVPFDFTAGVTALRSAVEDYGGVDDVHIYAVHFSDTPHESVNSIVRKEARELIEKDGGEQTIRPCQLTVEVQQVEEEKTQYIVPAIEEYAAEHDADKIIMSEHERSLLDRLFDTSNTDRIKESDVAPVTIV